MGLSLSNVGDQIIAFQSSNGSVTAAGAINIAGINYFYTSGTTTAGWNTDAPVGPNASLMPPGLTGGTSAFYTGAVTGTTAPASGKFNCTGAPSTTTANLRTAIMSVPNWTLSTNPVGFYSGCLFISNNPVVTGNPPNRTICAGANTTFTITATGATSYQWYQNIGNGFTALSNAAPVSGVTTTTLTITGAASTLNGAQYRCIATNTSGSSTSNNGTLTVSNVTVGGVKTDVLCNGSSTGTITINPTGGIVPYTYNWGSGITTKDRTGLLAGTYTVTVTDNIGCFSTASFTVNQPALAVSGTTVITNVGCNGGSNGAINLTPTGGTAPYTFNWGNGVTTEDRTGLSAGNFSVTITDINGCTALVNAIVTQPNALSATVTQTNVQCNGGNTGTATISVSGGTTPYAYAWSPSGGTAATATGLGVGTYTVTVTDANTCTITRTVTITQPAAIAAPTGAAIQSFTAGSTLSSLSANGQNIKWYASAANAANHTSTLPLTTVIVNNTTYYATQTVSGCESTASLAVLAFNSTLSVSDVIRNEAAIQIYPNPVTDILTVSGDVKILKLVIYSSEGRFVTEKILSNGDKTIDVHHLTQGIYTLHLITTSGAKTFKFIKK